MTLVAAAATAVVALAARGVRAQTDSSSNGATSNFAQCFCYNSETNTFCNGNNWFDSDACQKWLEADFAWVIPMVLLAFTLLFLPMCVLCARHCCRCCGGRYATHGFCCSDESTRVVFPGYKNLTIVAVRFAYLVALAAAVTASALTFNYNTKFHASVSNALSEVQPGLKGLQEYAQVVPSFSQYLMTQPLYFTNTYVPSLSTFSSDALDTLATTLKDIERAETDKWYGRHHLSETVSAWTLVIPVIALIPMACSWKRTMNVFFFIHCFVSLFVLIIATPSTVLAEFIGEACDHPQVTVNAILGGLNSLASPAFGTNLDGSLAQVHSTVSGMMTITYDGSTGSGFGSSGSASSTQAPTFCSDYIAVCTSIGGCPSTPCTSATFAVPSYGCPSQQQTQIWMDTAFYANMLGALSQSCSPSSATIQSLAATDARAARIVAFVNGVGPIASSNYIWSPIVAPFTTVQYTFCINGKSRAQSVAVGLFVQFAVSLAMLVVLFLGIKRFTHLNTYNQDAQVGYMSLQFENGVVTAIVVDTPMDAPWSPPPTGYAVSPTANYGTMSTDVGVYGTDYLAPPPTQSASTQEAGTAIQATHTVEQSTQEQPLLAEPVESDNIC